MLNEIREFNDYTGVIDYSSYGKRDTSYLGRFLFDSFLTFEGFSRILTIVARGYMFRENSSSDSARRALLAWCSLPDSKKATQRDEWQFKSDFCELHDEFPELVDENGCGWFYRHVKAVQQFIVQNPDKVNKSVYAKADLLGTKFDTAWRNTVLQYQVLLFSAETKGAWTLRFDDIIADAKELGELRDRTIQLSAETLLKIENMKPDDVPTEVISTLIQYYIANKPDDSDWVVLPVSSFDMFFGSAAFSKKWLGKIPESILVRENAFGVCRYMIQSEILCNT